MKKFGLLIIGILFMNLAFSQKASRELVSSSGESFKNTSYQLDWSIGECVTTTLIEGNYTITQGFHQTSFTISSIKDLATELNITVYPNPTANFLELKIENFKPESLQYILTNMQGNVLLQKDIIDTKMQLNFSSYSFGIYFLSIKQKDQIIKSFKIIKAN